MMEILGGHVGWPEGLLLFWIFIVLAMHATKDGEPVESPNNKYNGSMAIIRTAIMLTLLLWGGFFA